MAKNVFPPSGEVSRKAWVSSMDQYKDLYKRSMEDPDAFWSELSQQLYWKVKAPPKNLCRFNFDIGQGAISVKWFEGAKTNIAYNCLDRNVERGLGNKTAFLWEGNEVNDTKRITYKELLEEVCKFANVLKEKGMKKGDRVAIYMPMILELVVAMLACVRIGLVHSIVVSHTYVSYGPLLNAATSIMFEGIPFYPDASRFWNIIDKYKVSIFYTAPTAIRALMRFSDDYVKKTSRESLRLLGSVGEPINPEAWLWYHRVVGNSQCPIVDTFWQTETGGIVITPIPGCTPLKPGSATFPFFGVSAKLLSEEGKEIQGEGEGYLVFDRPWPGMMRNVFGSQERYETTYFKKFPGYYCTGDGAKRDSDGYLWITGRVDDMLNVSGHLLSTAAVESALITHPDVAETAVVSTPHPVKGECLYCFITLKEGREFNENMGKQLKEKVRYWIGPFATPEYLHITPNLPKTRSGKIMRRVLRKIAVNDHDLGDLTSLADDTLIEKLFQTRPVTD
ncbi:acetyl-coenzyme A synthetase, cytoplasmic [Trichonephila inaurata madagascariensis]|uniref:acetate--CoA ligase n=1 Tax=Trichonephila inaurata madagascariensis TaxID=2747483 RepID=A0A8X7BYL2_9ARAC|nr:acetyl-coenzyme A synthetase, cytoplasmic [Trichonephila inaurata madagascariensis]